MLAPWVSDAVLIALIGGTVSVVTAYMSNQAKKNADDILRELSKMAGRIEEVKAEVAESKKEIKEVKDIGLDNRSGIKNTQRYRLYADMKAELQRGYTTVSHAAEIGKLFESYTHLGGNGEIQDLHALYLKLPVKPD